MLMLATLLAAQCVSCVWWNASECNNTSFSALIKFFDVSKRRGPISSGGTNHFDRPAAGFCSFIYLLHVNSRPLLPPSPSPPTDLEAECLTFCQLLCGANKTSASWSSCHVGLITRRHSALAFGIHTYLSSQSSPVSSASTGPSLTDHQRSPLNNCRRQQVLFSPDNVFQSFFYLSRFVLLKREHSAFCCIQLSALTEKNSGRNLFDPFIMYTRVHGEKKTSAIVQENIPIYRHRLKEDSVRRRIFHSFTSRFYFKDAGIYLCLIVFSVAVHTQRTRRHANNTVLMQWI